MTSQIAARSEAELIEQEIAGVRADLDETIDLIEAKMTPGAILENVLQRASDGTSALAHRVGGALWRQPLAAAAASAGAKWFLSSRQKKPKIRVTAGRIRKGLAEARVRAEERAHELSDTLQQKAEATRDTVREQASQTLQKVETLSEKARAKLDEHREDITAYSVVAKERLKTGGAAMRDFAEAHPLATAVLAVAIGGACAALLPTAGRSRAVKLAATAARAGAASIASQGAKKLRTRAKAAIDGAADGARDKLEKAEKAVVH